MPEAIAATARYLGEAAARDFAATKSSLPGMRMALTPESARLQEL